MKFNPNTNRLYTDDNVLIKRLHCPYRLRWSGLAPTDDASLRLCTVCERKIADTAVLTDDVVLSIATRDPSACFRVSLNQDNVRVVHQDV